MDEKFIKHLDQLLDNNEIRITEFSDCLLSIINDTSLCSRLQKLQKSTMQETPEIENASNNTSSDLKTKNMDVIIIGSGLSGLTAAISLVDRGAQVLLLEKNAFMGGNSSYASSGINAVDPKSVDGDTVEQYLQDTLKSSEAAENSKTHKLIQILTQNSYEALLWIRNRIELPFNLKGQLGGHTYARTYRPENGLAGSKMIFTMSNLAKKIQKTTGRLQIMLNTTVTELLMENKKVRGVSVLSSDYDIDEYNASHVILATGGYASDWESNSLLVKYRDDLTHFKTTNGEFATGDGHKIVSLAGGSLIDMKNVQVHPTAFIDPKHPDAPRKTLCAEILRGVGGILLNKQGKRFCNELGRRDVTVKKMKQTETDDLKFTILLPEKVKEFASKHIPLYSSKGLLTKLSSLHEVANWLDIELSQLQKTLDQYNKVAQQGEDSFGKKDFRNTPFQEGIYYVGTVTPALHYTMGGIHIDTQARVLDSENNVITGLYSIGEATGGVHGINRLGGNALTECVVYGRLLGSQLPLANSTTPSQIVTLDKTKKSTQHNMKVIATSELQKHTSEQDCWVAVHGKVYDLTKFLNEHPPGPQSILDYAGTDATEIFDSVHTKDMLDDFVPLGVLEGHEVQLKIITNQELAKHTSEKDCWVAVHGKVYNLTNFLDEHPPGAQSILDYAGTDATEIFDSVHTPEMLDEFTPIGILESAASSDTTSSSATSSNTTNATSPTPVISKEGMTQYLEKLMEKNEINIPSFTNCLLGLTKNIICPELKTLEKSKKTPATSAQKNTLSKNTTPPDNSFDAPQKQQLDQFLEKVLQENNISIVEFTDCLLQLYHGKLCPRLQNKLQEIKTKKKNKKISWADDAQNGSRDLHQTKIIPLVGKGRPVPKR